MAAKIPDRKIWGEGERIPGAGHKMHPYSFLFHDHIFCIVDVAVQGENKICLVVVYERQHFTGSGGDNFQCDFRIIFFKRSIIFAENGTAQRICHCQSYMTADGSCFLHVFLKLRSQFVDFVSVIQDLPAFFG